MKTIISKIVAIKHKNLLAIFALFTCVFFANLFIGFDSGDDLMFFDFAKQFSLFDFLKYRYVSWSGRFFSETIAYVMSSSNIFLWRIFNSTILVFFVVGLADFFNLKRKLSENQLLWLRFFAIAGIASMGLYVLEGSIFWVTGSICYLWPMTAALWVMHFFWDSIINPNIKPKKFLNYLALPLGLYACLATEQIALVSLGFVFISILYRVIKKQNISGWSLVVFAVMLLAFVVSFSAPGNSVRFAHEMQRLMPSFLEMSLAQHFVMTWQWFINALINENRMLLLLLWAFLGVNLYKKQGLLSNFSYLFFVYLVLLVLNSLGFLRFLFNVGAEPYVLMPNYLLPLVWWSASVVFTAVGICFSFDDFYKKIFFLIIYIAALCSAWLIMFSPTIYASGMRTLFVMDVGFLLIIMEYGKNIKGSFTWYLALSGIALMQFINGILKI